MAINPMEMLAAVGVAHPEVTIADYFTDYEPGKDANNCCTKCAKCGTGGCEWDRRGAPVPGWIAEETWQGSHLTAAKIYYCPKFVRETSGTAVPPDQWDEEGSFRLLVKIAEESAEEYRTTLAKMKKLQRELNTIDDKSYDWMALAEQYYGLIKEKDQLEIMLYSHCESLKCRCRFVDKPELDLKVRKAVARRCSNVSKKKTDENV